MRIASETVEFGDHQRRLADPTFGERLLKLGAVDLLATRTGVRRLAAGCVMTRFAKPPRSRAPARGWSDGKCCMDRLGLSLAHLELFRHTSCHPAELSCSARCRSTYSLSATRPLSRKVSG